MPAETEVYYVRVRGKISGPFDLIVLQRMVQRGQLSRVHEISTDQQNWRPAPSITGLFAATTRKTVDQAGGAAVGIATPDVPDISMFQCNSCGAAFPKTESFQLGEQQLCTKCYERIAGPAPSEPVAAGGTNWMGILSKARQEQSDPSNPSEASGTESGEWYELADDGRPRTQPEQPLSVGLVALLIRPASGIFEAYQKLGPEKSIAVGLAGALIFEASLPLCSHYSLLDVLRFIYFSNGETLNHVPVRSSDMVVTWVKVFAVATAPFIVFILAMFTSRSICRPGSPAAGDVLTAGAALAPFLLVNLVIAALGADSTASAVGFGLLAFSLMILTLFHGFRDIAGLAPQYAVLVVAGTLIVATCVTKVLAMVLFI